MRPVISPYASLPLDDPAFWAHKWQAGINTLDPSEINPRLASRSGVLWEPLERGPMPAPEIRCWIEGALVPESWWRVLDGQEATEEEREKLLAARNLENVADFQADRYGLTIRRTGLRALPTARRGQKTGDEDGFDRLQHTALEPLTPLALLHPSRDGEWWFALTPDYRGWVWAGDVAISESPAETRKFLPTEGRVLVEPLARLETPSGRTPVETGALLPDTKGTFPYPARSGGGKLLPGTARLLDPARTLPAFPELLPENIFSVALSPLGQPYGWGDLTPKGPGRDCSRFVQDVFKTFGFRLPRDASKQCAATQPAIEFAEGEDHAARAARLARLKRGPALLCMPGHIMLYLGEVNGCHHAVHSFWAYKKRNGSEEETVPVRRVVVSSLDLGLATNNGSLLERLTSVNLL